MELKELLELLDRETGVPHDAAHGEGVDGIGAGNGQQAHAIGHDDMLALTDDPEPSLFECADGLEVRNARNARHSLDGDLDLTHFRALREVGDRSQILSDGVFDVGEGLCLGIALRPAPGKAGSMDAEPFFRPLENDLVFHDAQYTLTRAIAARPCVFQPRPTRRCRTGSGLRGARKSSSPPGGDFRALRSRCPCTPHAEKRRRMSA
jgi:hypothetical protein